MIEKDSDSGSSCAPPVSPVDTVVHFNLELDRLFLAKNYAKTCDLLGALPPAILKLQVSIMHRMTIIISSVLFCCCKDQFIVLFIASKIITRILLMNIHDSWAKL